MDVHPNFIRNVFSDGEPFESGNESAQGVREAQVNAKKFF